MSKNAAIMCGMYILNGTHGPESKSSGGNTSPIPLFSALIFRPAFNGMRWRGCVSAMGVIKTPIFLF